MDFAKLGFFNIDAGPERVGSCDGIDWGGGESHVAGFKDSVLYNPIHRCINLCINELPLIKGKLGLRLADRCLCGIKGFRRVVKLLFRVELGMCELFDSGKGSLSVDQLDLVPGEGRLVRIHHVLITNRIHRRHQLAFLDGGAFKIEKFFDPPRVMKGELDFPQVNVSIKSQAVLGDVSGGEDFLVEDCKDDGGEDDNCQNKPFFGGHAGTPCERL